LRVRHPGEKATSLKHFWTTMCVRIPRQEHMSNNKPGEADLDLLESLAKRAAHTDPDRRLPASPPAPALLAAASTLPLSSRASFHPLVVANYPSEPTPPSPVVAVAPPSPAKVEGLAKIEEQEPAVIVADQTPPFGVVMQYESAVASPVGVPAPPPRQLSSATPTWPPIDPMPEPRRSSSLSGISVVTAPLTEAPTPPDLDVTVVLPGRRRRNSTPFIVAGIAAVAVVGGGLLYVTRPTTAQVGINVADAQGHALDHVKIFVDGQERCQASPCVKEVSAGLHQVKVLCDGYDPPAVQAVAVAAGKPATAAFTLFPSTKAGTRQDPGAAAQALADTAAPLPADAPAVVLADAPVTPDPWPVAEHPRRTAGPVSPPGVAPAPANPPPTSSGASAAADSGEGFLNLNSIPAATCFLDGKSIGSTPMMHISVHAGVHTVKFVSAEQGLKKTMTVKVGAGETRAAITRLE
jgi:hypothetical protein